MQEDNSYSSFSDKVRAASDIVTTISAYVPLKKRGHNYWGCCPFHNEKTPSFSVVPDEGFFYCFGCHKGGDVFKFLSLIENVDYKEAIKLQAERLNIPIPQYRSLSPQEIEKEQKRNDLYKVLELARKFFFNCLTQTNYGKAGLIYLKERKIDRAIIDRFSLGFAPPSWDKLLTSFAKRGIPAALLAEAGLCVSRQKNDGYYDRFRSRVMIPIADEQGKIVGFGGRVLDDSQPKYLNSPETSIFNKRQLLFGLNVAKAAIRKADFIIIVEGYMDAIALVSHGIENTVASLGTAFTAEQCTRLLRFSKNLFFCYDSDNAGQTATLRALSIAHQQHALTKIIIVPDGKDPDEFIRKHDADAFRGLIQTALSFLEFHLQHIRKVVNPSTLEGKVKAVNMVLPILAQIDNAVELNGSIVAAAHGLGIDETDLRNELNRRRRPNRQASPTIRPIAAGVNNAALQAARCIIGRLWQEPDIIDYIFTLLDVDDFPRQEQKDILQFFAQTHQADGQLNNQAAAAALSEAAYAELLHCIADNSISQDFFDDCLHALRLEHLKRLYKQHSEKAAQLEQKGDTSFLQELEKLQRIIKEMDEF